MATGKRKNKFKRGPSKTRIERMFSLMRKVHLLYSMEGQIQQLKSKQGAE